MKKTKLFFQDKYVGSFRVGSNQHVKRPTFVAKVRSAIETVALYSVLTLTVVASVIFITKGTDSAQAEVVDNLSPKVEEMKWEVVKTIKDCERREYVESDGLITFDPSESGNKSVEPPSIGLLQFKITTVQYYHNLIYKKPITRTEAVILALDDKKSSQLAYDIMFKTKSSVKDWHTCGNKKEVQDILKIIKKLQ